MKISKEKRLLIGERMNAYIKHKNVSQDDLALTTGFTRQTINNIINGRNPASSDLLVKMSIRFTDLNVNWLLTGTGKMILNKTAQSDYDPRTEYTFDSLLEIIDNKDEIIVQLKNSLNRQDEIIKTLKEVNKSLLDNNIHSENAKK